MAVRDIYRVRYDATGGEAGIAFAGLSPAAAPDKLEELRLTRNGADLDHDELVITTDGNGYGTGVAWDVPGGAEGDYAILAGEWFDLWYLGEVIPTHPGTATKAAVLDAAMTLVRSPEGLSVTIADISDLDLQVACEASYYDLLARFSSQIPTVASLSAVDGGTGSDVYHFARAVGFLASGRLIGGIQAGRTGSFQLKSRLEADDSSEGWHAALAVKPEDFAPRCERELSLVSLIAAARTAATITLFGVSGPRKARQASAVPAWTQAVRDLFGSDLV